MLTPGELLLLYMPILPMHTFHWERELGFLIQWMPCSSHWAVLQLQAKTGMPGMRNPGALPGVPSVCPPPGCPLLPWPVARTGYSPERRATHTHTRLVIRKKHSVSVWNGLSLTLWPPGLPCVAVGKALTHDRVQASGQQWVRSSKATSMAKAGGEH